MSYTVNATAILREDHTVTATFTLPNDVPPGEVRIVAIVEPARTLRLVTGAELVASEFFGDISDGDGWPDTPEMFLKWRRSLWERSPE